MKTSSFFVLTYYHIIYSIIYSQELPGKKNLYIQDNYLKIDNELVDRIRDLGIFDNVVLYSEVELRKTLFKELKSLESYNDKTKDDNKKMLDKIFKPFFDEFTNIVENEDLYIFNVRIMIYNYIYDLDNKITLIEDGYMSLIQQENIHIFKGNFTLLNKYIGNGYAKLDFSDKRISRIIGSNPIEEIPTNLQDKYERNDFIDMKDKDRKKYKQQLNVVFNLPNLDKSKKSSLILTQPLARAHYCYCDEQLLLYKKMVRKALDNAEIVYIKKHPADDLCYSSLENNRVKVIDSLFPIELLTFEDIYFEEIWTFGSTALEIMDNCRKKIKVFPDKKFDFKKVILDIRKYIKNEKINITLISNDKSLPILIEKLNNRRNNNYFYRQVDVENRRNVCECLDVNYVHYDDISIEYNEIFLKDLEKFIKNKVQDIFVLSSKLLHKSAEYKDESGTKRDYLSETFFDKVIGFNIYKELNENELDFSSLYYNSLGVSYLSKATVTVDYSKVIEMIENYSTIDIFQIASLQKEKYFKVGLKKIDSTIVAIDKYYLSLMCSYNTILETNKFNIRDYLDKLDEEERLLLVEDVFCNYLSAKKIKKTAGLARKKLIEQKINKQRILLRKIVKKLKNIIK